MLNKIAISVNNDPIYYQNYKLVHRGWGKFFPEAEICLIFIRKDRNDDPIIAALNKISPVIVYDAIPELSASRQAYIGRLFFATQQKEQVVMVNDVDLVPLQRQYFQAYFEIRNPGELLQIGSDAYKNTKDAGKFPMGYTTAEGYTWEKLLNPKKLNWRDWLFSLKGSAKKDIYEDPWNTKNFFSDESLMRIALIRNPVSCCNIGPYISDIYENSISRPHWKIDLDKLNRGDYIESHLIRPIASNLDKVRPIADYLGFSKEESILAI